MAVQIPPWIRSVLGIHRIFTSEDVELTTTSDLQLTDGLEASYNQTTGRIELSSDQNATSIGGIPLEDPFDPEEGDTLQFNGSEWITAVAGASNATQLQGVDLEAATIGAPDPGDVVVFDGSDWVAAQPDVQTDALSLRSVGLATNVGAPSNGDVLTYNNGTTRWEAAAPASGGLPAPYSISGNNFRVAASATSPQWYQLDETTNSVNGDALTIQAQNSTGTTTTGGSLILASGTGTTAAGTVQINAGSTLMLTVANGAITYSTSAATTGQLRLPKDFTIVGRNDAGSGNVQLLDWGAAADELVLGADTVAKITSRSAANHEFWGNGSKLASFTRTPAFFDLETISVIAYKSTGVINFTSSGTARTLGFFDNGSTITNEDQVLRIGTTIQAPAGTDNGGSYLWAAGTNGLELRTHTLNATTALLSAYIALGATPSTMATGVSLTNNTGVSIRNNANSANLLVLSVNTSDNVTLGYDSGGTNLDVRASSAVRTFSGGVGSAQLGRASTDFIRMGGTGYASTGLIRVVHNSSPIVGLNNAGSTDRSIVRWGTTTDTAIFGDAAANSTLDGLAIVIGSAAGSITTNASSTGYAFQTAGAARLSLTGTNLTVSAGVAVNFAASHTGPVVSQLITATNSVTGSPFALNAQDCSGTTAVTAGAMTIRAGNATGGSGTRNGGKMTVAGGTGATADGNLALAVKGADFFTCVAAATPYIRLDGHETATTVGAAGAGAALPLTPTAYLRIDIGGTRFKIPYYAD